MSDLYVLIELLISSSSSDEDELIMHSEKNTTWKKAERELNSHGAPQLYTDTGAGQPKLILFFCITANPFHCALFIIYWSYRSILSILFIDSASR